MARNTWYRLDNIGKFYSSQAGSSAQTIFRYSATLVDEVDPAILQNALEKTVDIFPGFNVTLRSGMFWHYLEQAAERPLVQKENLPICFGLHVHAKSVLFRVSYYRKRINVEVSHMISDGRGTLSFFKALLYLYLQQRYQIEDVSLEYDGSDFQKSEDSFNKYYERDKAAATHAPKVYRLSGWRDETDPTFMEYHVSAQKVLELARSYNVSLTSLIIAAIICAVRSEMTQRDRKRSIRIEVPVDLRQFFESTTVKNFFGLAFISYTPGAEDEPIEKVAAHVHEQVKLATQPEHLKSRMNRMIALEKNPLLRFAPLFVKDAALEVAARFASRGTTTTVSSLGRISFDERLANYVSDINVLTSTTGLNFVICTFADDLSIGISTIYSNPDIIKKVCRYFSSKGIEGHININKTKEEIAEDWRETKLETSVKRLGDQVLVREEGEKPQKNKEKQHAKHNKQAKTKNKQKRKRTGAEDEAL